jgi:single-stranded-DNA-specific exonuclease
MAAGLTVRVEEIGRLRDFLNQRMAGEQAEEEAPAESAAVA